jgi:hypothetical protein
MIGDEAAEWFDSCVGHVGRGGWSVAFSGYDNDPREIWEIKACIITCKSFVRYGLLEFMTVESGWLFFKTAKRLFIPGTATATFTDADISEFLQITQREEQQWKRNLTTGNT